MNKKVTHGNHVARVTFFQYLSPFNQVILQ